MRKGASQRAAQRVRELKVLLRHARYPRRITWQDFIQHLTRIANGRDALDPTAVCPVELGRFLKLTLQRKVDIEDKETAHGRARGWRRRNDQPYYFRIVTVAPYDHTLDDVRQFYKRRANKQLAENRKVQRANRFATTNAQPTMSATQKPAASYAGLRAARVAITKAQIDSLLVAIGDDENSVAELIERVRDHASWRVITDQVKLRRAVYDRLDALRLADQISDRYQVGPRGSSVRLVSRRRLTTAEAAATARPCD
jgi:hypothetical protein